MNISDPQSVVGKNVIGTDDEKIGKVEELYLDTGSNQPEWISVTTGLFGSHRSLVPLAEASDEGGDLRIPYSKDQVKEAPHYDPDQHLSEEEAGLRLTTGPRHATLGIDHEIADQPRPRERSERQERRRRIAAR